MATAPASSRRSLLRAGIAGLAGLALGAFGKARPADAAAGGPLVMGASNTAGTSNTTLSTTSTGTALHVYQYGSGTALRGQADAGIAGFFTSFNGAGVSGVTANKDKIGVYAANDAIATGTGCALRANGKQGIAVNATSVSLTAPTIKAQNLVPTPGPNQAPTILGLLGQGSAADTHPPAYDIAGAAAEFSGPTGLIAASSPDLVNGKAVVAISESSSGNAVVGQALGDFGTAIWGQCQTYTGAPQAIRGDVWSTGDNACAVGAYASGETGKTFAVYAANSSATGTAVYAHASAPTGFAIDAKNTGTGGAAVAVSARSLQSSYGCAVDARGSYFGVYGSAGAAAGTTYGVFGMATSATGYALYGNGNGAVSGSFSKASGSFKIDHPLDPANKFLYHSFVESPDMKNVYDGVVTLDAKGEATVELPDWFEALNRDFRYQLTAMGAAAPDLHLKSGVHAGRFSIAGGRAGQDVSWQVTGIRHDAWAEAHRIEVEVAKSGPEAGRYLHPAEHGRPRSLGIEPKPPAAEESDAPAPSAPGGPGRR